MEQPIYHRRRRRSFWRRFRWWILGGAVLLLAAGITVTCILLTNDPYKKVLKNVGIEPAQYDKTKQTVSVTFDKDAQGVLLCREALNAWRAAEKHPKTVEWTITGGKQPVKGTIENLDYIPEPQSPRVETLGEEITRVKLIGVFMESGISATVEFLPTLGAEGKTVSIQMESTADDVQEDLPPVLTALRAVNEEGGGIIRCNVTFTENDTVIAVASYDLLYGDEILSSLFFND